MCHSDADESRNIDAVQRWLVRRAVRRLPKLAMGSRGAVLDYGCGSGRWAPYFSELGYDYRCVDLAEEMVRLARGTSQAYKFDVLPASGRLPWGSGAFSLVCSLAVLHHNPLDDQMGILEELVRVLAPAGHLILLESVADPDPANPVEFGRPRDEWIAILQGLGLEFVWWEGGRYFLPHTLLNRFEDRFGWKQRVTPRTRPRRWALRAGRWTDPMLGAFLPEHFHRRVVMLFRKG